MRFRIYDPSESAGTCRFERWKIGDVFDGVLDVVMSLMVFWMW